ncbi:PEP/pyruvate-binding domain-containing protein [Rhodoluna sp.]|uniref:PEP/pyruvate-binding domain-containing protein n=1 Tax=Rhodoluna sp. TaxID=1969481 RepID=UPI0025D4E68B|nr:PEP/pyruvate-binding domain-containing protein [Rhodoluna sp.]
MYTFPFDSAETPQHERLGGKCTSLAIMTKAGAPVPPGFAVTTDAYDEVMRGTDLFENIEALLANIDINDVAAVDQASAKIRDMIMQQPVPSDVHEETHKAYDELMQLCGGEVPVAVRSSATAEDLPDASFAGQQDTYLWIIGRDNVMQKIRECWASLYTSRAITYRKANNIADEGLSMAVAVQKMVNSRTSGVAMTIDPSNGDRSKIVIDSSWGLGEMVVSGEVTPDNFVIDKIMLHPVKTIISDKHEELIPDGKGGIIKQEVDEARRNKPSLSSEEIIAVARLAKSAEKHYGCVQDIEWAIDADLPDGQNVLLLQSRPETVWSQKPAEVKYTSMGSGIEAITTSLMAQISTDRAGKTGS